MTAMTTALEQVYTEFLKASVLQKCLKAVTYPDLSKLIEVFRRAWNEQSYHKIARKLNREYSYIKDVGAELWQLLAQVSEINPSMGFKLLKNQSPQLEKGMPQYFKLYSIAGETMSEKCTRKRCRMFD